MAEKKPGFFKRFKDFISRGNVIDLAVAVVIGRAFSEIVTSFVSDILMPPIGYFIQGVDFSNLGLTLKDKIVTGKPVVVIRYGAFLNTVVDFLIIAFAIFLFVSLIGKIRRPKIEEVTNGECSECLMPIPKKARKCYHCGSEVKS